MAIRYDDNIRGPVRDRSPMGDRSLIDNRSGDAELIAFRIGHHYVVSGELLQRGRTGSTESGDLGHHTGPALLGWAVPGYREIEMEPVLGGLRLGNLKQAQARRDARRVHAATLRSFRRRTRRRTATATPHARRTVWAAVRRRTRAAFFQNSASSCGFAQSKVRSIRVSIYQT